MSGARVGPVRFGRWLAAISVAGLVLRMAYAIVERDLDVSNDGGYYRFAAGALVDGLGFVHPFSSEPFALHPPGWPVVLSLAPLLGFESELAHQLLAALVGATSVVLVGLAGRAVAGARVGLIAALIAAVHPNLWLYERTLFSETLVVPLVAALVLVGHKHWHHPRVRTAVAVGGLSGLLALVRSEQLLLVGVLLAPLVLLAGRSTIDLRRRLVWLALGAGTAVAVLIPWFAHNAARFEEPVLVTTGLGITLRIANCPASYGDELLGHIDEQCYYAAAPGDGSTQDVFLRGRALEFVRDNASRVPAVVAARLGRTWGLYRPFQQMRLDAGYARDPLWVHRAGYITYWLVAPLAVGGAVVLRRRGVPLSTLLAFVVVVVAATTITYGQPRFRVPAEVPLIILAAVAIDAGLRRARRRRGEAAVGHTRAAVHAAPASSP